MEGRAAQVSRMVFNNPNQQCYTQFFVGGGPPTGLRTGQGQKIVYICQMVNQQTYYGTMFDENRGVAVFSAYTLTQGNVNFQPGRPRPNWKQTPGNYSQSTDRSVCISVLMSVCLFVCSSLRRWCGGINYFVCMPVGLPWLSG